MLSVFMFLFSLLIFAYGVMTSFTSGFISQSRIVYNSPESSPRFQGEAKKVLSTTANKRPASVKAHWKKPTPPGSSEITSSGSVK
jgi:hypothetical protein